MIKPINTMMKSIQENAGLSPHKNRVFYKKYINQVNEALQSLIVAGKLKRMELMSINNRALFNRGKVQRSEWTNHKHLPSYQSFLPDVKNLNLDTRSPKQKSAVARRTKTQSKHVTSSIRPQQNLIDDLIQQQLQKIKAKNILNSGRSQQQIVQQACRAIEQKIIQSHNKNTSRKYTLPTNSFSDTKNSHHKFKLTRKDHRRSVTQSMYSQQLQGLEKKNNAFFKSVEADKKYFLRKIRKFGIKNK